MLNKTCTPNKTEDLNLSVFFLIKSRNKSETLAKRISCECKLKFDGTNASQIDGEISVDVSVKRFMYMYFKHTFFKQFYQHKRFCPRWQYNRWEVIQKYSHLLYWIWHNQKDINSEA